MIKNIKNLFKPSVKKQMKKTVSKEPEVEHAFVKFPRKKIQEASKEKTPNSVDLDFNKVNKYLKKHGLDPNKLSTIHTHTHIKNNIDLPSFADIVASLNKRYHHVSVWNGKTEVGRISYAFNPSLKIKTEINKIFKLREKMNSDITRAEKILLPVVFQALVKTYTQVYYTELETSLTKTRRVWLKKNPNKPILDFYKEIGLSIRFTPNKKEGYTYDYTKLQFIKN